MIYFIPTFEGYDFPCHRSIFKNYIFLYFIFYVNLYYMNTNRTKNLTGGRNHNLKPKFWSRENNTWLLFGNNVSLHIFNLAARFVNMQFHILLRSCMVLILAWIVSDTLCLPVFWDSIWVWSETEQLCGLCRKMSMKKRSIMNILKSDPHAFKILFLSPNQTNCSCSYWWR